MREIILKPVLIDEQVAALDNQFLSPAHCVESITTSTIARTAGGQIRFMFVRNVIGEELRDLAETNIGRIGYSAKQSNRAAVRGEQGKEAIWGFMEASKFRPEAGMTGLTLQHLEKFINALPFFEAVTEQFRLYWPEAHGFQQQMAARAPEFIIPNTIHSTLTINSGNVITRVHTDAGNAEGTISCLTQLGNFKGGHICLPRYGVLIESNPGDLFLAAIRDEPHGNLGPIEGERIACVFYLRGGCSLPRRRWFLMSDAVDRSDGAERSGEGMNTMTIQAECGDDLYPDELVCEILASTRPGRPGVSEYADGSLWYVFVWCDKTCAARGVLFIMPAADASGWVTGSDFTIFVHPNWRRKGIATKLYRAACSYYEFELAVDPLYTPAGAAWALSVLESEAGSKPDEGQ